MNLLLLSALAWADAPEFLLADVGVRVDLPRSWKMTKWADWEFAGQNADGSVLVFAWATPVQAPVTDAAAWAPVFLGKVGEMSGKEAKAGASKLETVGGRSVAMVDVGFQYRDGNRGTMYGATIEVEGQNFHLACISPDKFSGAGKKAREELVGRLEFTKGPPASTFGAEVTATGVTTKLPPDWRPSTDTDWNAIVSNLAKLGLSDVEGCWVAVRPRPAATPDAMVTCSRKLELGVVDEHSFAAADELVRGKLFGKIPPGVRVPLADRSGFLYAPKDGVAFGVVPDAEGGAVTYAIGEGDMGAAARGAMEASTWSGPHPVTTGETVSYWLTARTFSPQVLCPALGCLGVGGGLVVVVGAVGVMGATRKRPDEGDDDAG